MPDQLQLRGGTTTEHNSFTGALREVTVDTTKKTLVVHDGSSAGGTALMKESGATAASSVTIGTGGVERLKLTSSEVVFNETSTDTDFRIEGNGEANLFKVDAGNDRIGIGTASPTARLDVRRSDTDGLIAEFHQSAGFGIDIGSSQSTAYISSGHAQAFTFKTNAGSGQTERMRISKDGRVGIGESSPSKTLVVSEDDSECVAIIKSSDTGTAGIFLGDQSDEIKGGILFDNSTNALTLQGHNNATRLTIDSSGRVLIGATTEGNESADELTIGSSGNTGITLRSGTSANTSLFFSDATSGAAEYAGSIQYRHASDIMTFGTATAERMRIFNNGTVGIGTTSVGSGTLTIKGTSAAYGGVGNATVSSGAILQLEDSAGRKCQLVAPGTQANSGVGTITNHIFILFTSNQMACSLDSRNLSDPGFKVGTGAASVNTSSFGTKIQYDGGFGNFRDVTGANTVFRSGGNQGQANIFGDGDITNNNNSYGQASDETLKQDIVDAASQWEDIKALRVRKFRFKDNPTGVLQIGVVAQELETVSAGLVKENSEGIKSVKYSVLYMKAVKCLQEAITKIETLETKVAALEAA